MIVMANCILRTVTHIVQGNHCPIFLLIIGYSQGQQRSAKKQEILQEILAAEKSTIQLARAADVPGVRDAA
jgi:carbonic anhydrase/acetyltransferase-like protein (isoleucine patch superfamily)